MSATWDVYQEGNGAPSLDELRRLIGAHVDLGPRDDPEIGCILLRDVRFFPPEVIAGPPPDFARNLVQGRGYDLDDPHYSGYFDALTASVLGIQAEIDRGSPGWRHTGPMWSDSRLRRERLGQRGFQVAVLNAYNRRCAITRGRAQDRQRPAAEVRYPHHVRSRVPRRDPGYRLRVSPLLREVFGNGDSYYARQGQVIALPERGNQRPNPDYLDWHMREVFQAS